MTSAADRGSLGRMSGETRELLERALKLPADDRAILAEALHASLGDDDTDDDAPEDPAVARRLARGDRAPRARVPRGQGEADPADEVHAGVLAAVERARARRGTSPPRA